MMFTWQVSNQINSVNVIQKANQVQSTRHIFDECVKKCVKKYCDKTQARAVKLKFYWCSTLLEASSCLQIEGGGGDMNILTIAPWYVLLHTYTYTCIHIYKYV